MRFVVLLLLAGCATTPTPMPAPAQTRALDEVWKRELEEAKCRLGMQQRRADRANQTLRRVRDALQRPTTPALAACTTGAFLTEALACLERRRTELSQPTNCGSEPHCEVTRRLMNVRAELAERETRQGPAHPEMLRLQATSGALLAWAERLRAVELDALEQTALALQKERKASPAVVWARTRLERVKRFDPSLGAAEDLPTSLQALAFDIAAAQLELELAADRWGDQHPRRRVLELKLEAARARAPELVAKESTWLAAHPDAMPLAVAAITLQTDDDTADVCAR